MSRPAGTGSQHVRWEPPRGEGAGSRRSGRLFVGLALYEALHHPARLRLERRSGQLARPGDRGAVMPGPKKGAAVSGGAEVGRLGGRRPETLRLTERALAIAREDCAARAGSARKADIEAHVSGLIEATCDPRAIVAVVPDAAALIPWLELVRSQVIHEDVQRGLDALLAAAVVASNRKKEN